jgi:hypothetical protein
MKPRGSAFERAVVPFTTVQMFWLVLNAENAIRSPFGQKVAAILGWFSEASA